MSSPKTIVLTSCVRQYFDKKAASSHVDTIMARNKQQNAIEEYKEFVKQFEYMAHTVKFKNRATSLRNNILQCTAEFNTKKAQTEVLEKKYHQFEALHQEAKERVPLYFENLFDPVDGIIS